MNVYLKNLLYFIHQNFLIAGRFIHSRIMNKRDIRDNTWVQNIKKVIDDKMVSVIRNKGDAVQSLRVNLMNAENIITNIIKANQKKQFFIVLNEYITKLPLFPNVRIRDTLYNIE